MLTPFPVTEQLLTYYAAFLAEEGLKEQSIKTYIAALHHVQIAMGLPDPRDTSSLPRLRLVLTGIKRTQAEAGSPSRNPRLPITPPILQRIRSLWDSSPKRVEYVLPWAAVTLCFFGFFRSGEITVPSREAFDPQVHLSWGDVAIDDRNNPQAVRVHLRRSKTDQFRNGIDIVIGRTGDSLCPVAAVCAFMVRRGSSPGPFFMFPDGTPLTKARFVNVVRTALQELGLPQEQFAGHSFWIGAATTAAQVGLEDSMIMMLGRWNSAAFLRYLRMPRESLASVTAQLSRKSKTQPETIG